MYKKYLLTLTILISVMIVVTGCSQKDSFSQLQILDYPDRVTQTESFSVTGKYLTKKPGKEKVEIIFSVFEADSKQRIYSAKKQITDSSQEFSFTNIKISDINNNIYFQLDLIKKGKYITQVNTKSTLSQVANWHTKIITTYFLPNDENTWGDPLKEENPFYFALPYRDFSFEVLDIEKDEIVWGEEKYYGISNVKNRWIEIYYPETKETVYAQWEDVGPWNIYDPNYVFSKNDHRPYAEMGIDMGWLGYYRETNKAGLDISPKAMRYLNNGTLKGKIKVNWRFVNSSEVPDGPWKENISSKKANPKVFNTNTQTLRNSSN